MTDPLPPDLRARLRAIGAFAAELEAPDFHAGDWHPSEHETGRMAAIARRAATLAG